MMDYMNMDERSIGMFWVVTYTMAQPACETVMNWLNSAGVADLLPGTNLPGERLVATREVSPLPMSLLSGFSINLCVKLSYQMEDSLFSGQVISPSLYLMLRFIYQYDSLLNTFLIKQVCASNTMLFAIPTNLTRQITSITCSIFKYH